MQLAMTSIRPDLATRIAPAAHRRNHDPVPGAGTPGVNSNEIAETTRGLRSRVWTDSAGRRLSAPLQRRESCTRPSQMNRTAARATSSNTKVLARPCPKTHLFREAAGLGPEDPAEVGRARAGSACARDWLNDTRSIRPGMGSSTNHIVAQPGRPHRRAMRRCPSKGGYLRTFRRRRAGNEQRTMCRRGTSGCFGRVRKCRPARRSAR